MSTEPSLATKVGPVNLPSCVYNASGPRTGSSAALGKIAASSAGAVLAKSATLVSQTGNPLPRTWHHEGELDGKGGANDSSSQASLNSEGLPNAGIDYYISSETISEAMGTDDGSSIKPYMVSISGHTLQDNLLMLSKINSAPTASAIAAVELNLACPNVIGHPIIAYDFEQMASVLQSVSSLPMFANAASNPSKPIMPLGVKMPPYFDGPHFEKAASILNQYKHIIKYVTCINTIGNAFAIDIHAEMPVIRSKGGFAGLSGPAIKYTALANIKKMRELLSEEIDVVGAGGVSSGRDAFEMILCGASAVQVGTCHWIEGPKCFDRICNELKEIMKTKGYTCVDDFRGRLKEWSKEGAAVARAARKDAKDKLSSGGGSASLSSDSLGGLTDVHQIFSAVLLVAVAVLLADKFGYVTI